MTNVATRAPGRQYSFAEHGNSDFNSRAGMYLIKNNAAEVWSPPWGGGPMTVRIFPARNPEDPTGTTWDPYRLSTDKPNDFGDWIRRYSAVRGFGERGVTMIIGDPANDSAEDRFQSPAWVLYNAVDLAIKNKQEGQGWAALMKGGANRGAQLSRPSEVYLVQCCVVWNKTKAYDPPKGLADGDPLVVLALGPSAAQAMLAEMNVPRTDGAPQSNVDFEQLFVGGDPINLDCGRFVTFFKLGEDPRQAQQPAAASGWNLSGNRGMGGQQREAIGHGCFLSPVFGQIGANMRQLEPWIARKVRPWSDILYFPSPDEQAHLLVDQFPPDVILYAWRNHPHWIPDGLRAQAANTMYSPPPSHSPGFQNFGGQPGFPPTGPGFQPGVVPQPGGAPAGFTPQAMPNMAPPTASPPVMPAAGFGLPGAPQAQQAQQASQAGFHGVPNASPPSQPVPLPPSPQAGGFGLPNAAPPAQPVPLPSQPAPPAYPAQMPPPAFQQPAPAAAPPQFPGAAGGMPPMAWPGQPGAAAAPAWTGQPNAAAPPRGPAVDSALGAGMPPGMPQAAPAPLQLPPALPADPFAPRPGQPPVMQTPSLQPPAMQPQTAPPPPAMTQPMMQPQQPVQQPLQQPQQPQQPATSDRVAAAFAAVQALQGGIPPQ